MYYIQNTMKSIINDEDAYWLGFLFADGFVSKNRNRVVLELNIKDIEHVEKFKKYLNTDRPIYIKEKYNSCGIQIDNEDLHNNLIKHGCIPLKSKIDSFIPNNILEDDDLFFSFIRGLFDGDGCVFWQNESKIGVFLMGTQSIINTIHTKLFFKDFNITKENRSENCYYLRSAKHSLIMEIYNRFYKNASIYLDRKKNIFDEYIKVSNNKEGFYHKKYRILYNKYLEIKKENTDMTMNEIAGALNVSKTTLYNIIKKCS